MWEAALVKLIEASPYAGFAILLGWIFSSQFKHFTNTLEKNFETSLAAIEKAYKRSEDTRVHIMNLKASN